MIAEQRKNILTIYPIDVFYRCGKYDEEREFMFRKIEQKKKKVVFLGVNKIIRNRD